MALRRTLIRRTRGHNAGVGRLLRYWLLGLGLYVVSLAMLWFEAWAGVATVHDAVWLSAMSIGGAALAYAAIRASPRLGLPAGVINTGQSMYAIACIVGAYAALGPMRAVTLTILVVVLVFGGFSASPRQLRTMTAFAVALLGLTIGWKASTDAARYPPMEEVTHFVIGSAMLLTVSYLASLLSRLRKQLKVRTLELADALERIRDIAGHDELTRLINRRQMLEVLKHEGARRDRSGEPLCLALIDIDHFKAVNDTRGHAAGDLVLKAFATQALAAVRRSDILARWGGEEFLLLLPATALEPALDVLGRMRAHVGDTALSGDDGASLGVTFSAGLVESAAGESIEAAIEQADKAMYRAKREGRDRIVCAPARRTPLAAIAA